MRPITAAIEEVLNSSPEFQFGFSNKLFNLTQLAGFIKPMIEAKTKKDIQLNSLVMALSRMSRQQGKASRQLGSGRFKVENISVQSGLIVMTLYRTIENHRAAEAIYSKLKKKDSYFTMTEGSGEITLIFDQIHRELVQELLPQRPKLVRAQVASLSVKFHPKYIETPGLLHKILQQVSLQGINIIELASTATELIIYIRESEVRAGFDTLLKSFT